MPTAVLPEPASNVIDRPVDGLISHSIGNLVISVASAADSFIPWGKDVRARDAQLRAFWPTEYMFSGALFSTIAQYVSFGWTFKGPPRMVGITQELMNHVQFGQGPEALLEPFLIDYFTQDNGAFLEIVRTEDSPRAPVVSLNHLDSYKCERTGDYRNPVIYTDQKSRRHTLKWYNVCSMTEFPAPIEEGNGIQYCALTRILRAAQVARDIAIVKQEKAGGRFTRQVHLVGGVQNRVIEDAIAQKQADADQRGLYRYIQPLIVASLDPTSRVTKETIDLASIPEDYDEEKAQRAYILALSMTFGIDYQSLAPLPGGGLGSASNSKVMNMKARGKAPGLFMKKLQRLFNFHGILPSTVSLEFGFQDVAEQMEKTELRKSRAEEREVRIRSGEITTEVARQMAVDDGDLDPRYLVMMHEQNATDEYNIDDTEPFDDPADSTIKPGTPGPKEPPKAQTANSINPNGAIRRPANSNGKRDRSPVTNQRRTPGGTPENGDRA